MERQNIARSKQEKVRVVERNASQQPKKREADEHRGTPKVIHTDFRKWVNLQTSTSQ